MLTHAALAGHPSANIESTRVIVLDPAALDIDDTIERDAVRRTPYEHTDVVGTQDADGSNEWFGSDRARLGGEDAPARILVRAFDAVFAIDPFIELPVGNETAARVLFNGAGLELDRARFNRMRIDRTMELLHVLEGARRDWLRDNGYFGVRTFTSSGSGEERVSVEDIEPVGVFERPADVPRGKSFEQVRREERVRSGAAMLAGGDARVSLPFGTASDVVASVESREAGDEDQELASRD